MNGNEVVHHYRARRAREVAEYAEGTTPSTRRRLEVMLLPTITHVQRRLEGAG
jgi:hypothetical protein